jgi:hypothetical protein
MKVALIVDVFANWQLQSGLLRDTVISAGIDNVFDETYRVHPSGLDNPDVTAEVSLSRSFCRVDRSCSRGSGCAPRAPRRDRVRAGPGTDRAGMLLCYRVMFRHAQAQTKVCCVLKK